MIICHRKSRTGSANESRTTSATWLSDSLHNWCRAGDVQPNAVKQCAHKRVSVLRRMSGSATTGASRNTTSPRAKGRAASTANPTSAKKSTRNDALLNKRLKRMLVFLACSQSVWRHDFFFQKNNGSSFFEKSRRSRQIL